MAVTRHSTFDKTVNNIAERNSISNKVDGMTVVVLDAIADIDAGAGKAIYRWDASDSSWIIVSKSTTETISFETEEVLITNGVVPTAHFPTDNKLWGIKVINNQDTIIADLRLETLIVSNGTINLNTLAYDGNKLRFTYAYGTITQQITSAIKDAVATKFADLAGFSVDVVQQEVDRIETSVGLNSTGNYVSSPTSTYINSATSVKDATEKLDTAIKTVSDSIPNLNNYTGDIIPSANSVYDIGSTTNRFKSIYVDEAYLSTNTLYIGDTPILGTTDDTIIIKADPDQSILMKTSGLGTTNIESQTGVMVTTSGVNADVKVQATGVNSKVRFSGSGGIELSSPVSAQSDLSVSGNLTVTGNVTANGSQFLVNATTVTTKDNIITLNQGEVGTGVTAGKAGLQIDRGDSADFQLVFDETDDKFKVGMVGGTYETIATREYVTDSLGTTVQPYNAGTVVDSNYVHTDNNYTTAEKTKLSGIESGAQVNTVTSVVGKTGAVTLAKGDVGLNNVDNTSDLSKPISTATQTALNSKVDKVTGKGLSTEDYTTVEKTKLSGIESGAQVNTVTSVSGKTGSVTLTKSDVGLGNVDNTSDLNKPISTATQTALNNKVDKVSGKQLSTEDYTTAEKTKLSGLSNYVKPTSEPISYIDGLQTSLDSKVEKVSKQSLDAISALRVSGTTVSLYKGDGTFDSITTQDTVYTLPTATSAVKGGIEIFSDTVQTTAANAVSTTGGRTYGVQLNSVGQAVVNVPWSDTNTVYTHPNSGVTAGTYSKVTVNTLGHITAGASLSESDIPNLDASKITTGTIDAARLPSFVDDVLEFVNLAGFPATGEAGKIYIALDTNKTYRWSGSTYVYITSGAVDSVAGKTGVVTLAKSDVGLSNVDNTSDLSKPISTATQNALNLKVDKVSGKGLSTEDYTTAEKTKLSGIESGAQVNTVTSVANKTGAVSLTKSDVGLGNVDNTSDINKPISTATQTALNSKVDKVSGKQLSTEDYTTAEKTKLSGLSNYTLPVASTTVLGGVKAGANVTIDANGVISSSGAVTSVAGKTGAVTLTKSDVGLSNVDNTSDATKNVLSATKLTTARTINGVLFDGTSDISIEVGSTSPFWENDVTINESYTIGTNKNAMIVGPITVANNVDIIVPNGSSLKII